MKYFFIAIMLNLFCVYSFAQKIADNINWKQYMQQQSPYWDSVGTDYYSGILLGNGRLGTNIYKENENAIRFDIGRSDVTDQRPHSQDTIDGGKLVTRARLPIGKMLLLTKGKITGADMQLNLYDAVAKGVITTTAGQIHFEATVPTGEEVIFIEASGSDGEKHIQWRCEAEKSQSPRISVGRAKPSAEGYKPNPPVQIKDSVGYHISYQSLLYNGEYATLWKQVNIKKDSKIIIAVGYSAGKKGDAVPEAIKYINLFLSKKWDQVKNTHQAWWHHYFQQSFISIPDARMQGAYWMQMYNLAAATRKGAPMVDLAGPWATSRTPWPAIWWNLNTQLAYSPIFTSNHLDIGQSLFSTIKKNTISLINNVPEKWQYDAAAIGRTSSYDLTSPVSEELISSGHIEAANLTWTLFYYYQYFLYSGDTVELKNHIYPLLKRSVNFIIHLLQKDAKGVYHLIKTHSPEYADVEDANYSLSALRWGLQTLLHCDSMLNMKKAERKEWLDISEHLVAYPTNETGYMIGKNKALTSSHRHFSHLMMIYPYREINMDDIKSRELIEKSIAHWQSMPDALAGYSYVGASSMYSLLGEGNLSYENLNKFLIRHGEANCLYRESGPCFETPMAMANSLLEMMLQSNKGLIKIFPALPDAWKDAAFKKLRTEGAFLVTAKKANGITEFVKITAEHTGNAIVETTIPASQLKIISSIKNKAAIRISTINNKSFIHFSAEKGDDILIINKQSNNSLTLDPVRIEAFSNNYWGLQKQNRIALLKERKEMFGRN